MPARDNNVSSSKPAWQPKQEESQQLAMHEQQLMPANLPATGGNQSNPHSTWGDPPHTPHLDLAATRSQPLLDVTHHLRVLCCVRGTTAQPAGCEAQEKCAECLGQDVARIPFSSLSSSGGGGVCERVW